MTLLLIGVALGFVARIFVEAHSKINRDLKSMERWATRDQAVGRAEAERAKTGLPQLVTMHPDGSWSSRTLDGKRIWPKGYGSEAQFDAMYAQDEARRG